MSLLNLLKPASKGQEEILSVLKDKNIEIIGIFGPTGSGKSLLSLFYGVKSLIEGKYKRFLIVKPIINVVTGSEISIEIGKEIYEGIILEYFKDLIGNYLKYEEIERLIKEEKIKFIDLHYLKGRSFDNSLIFIDDIQNIPAESVIEVIIRIGNKSKLIVAGDPVFQRLKGIENEASSIIREILLSEEKAKVIDLGIKDIIRPGAKKGLRLLMELNLRNRELNEEEKKILNTIKTHAPDADVVTIMDIKKIKENFKIKQNLTPDLFVITKTPGKLIGKKGERISKIEKEIGKKIRILELNLDFKEWIIYIHPLSWILKYILEVDFAGAKIKIKINKEGAGAFIGQRGNYVRYLEEIFKELLGIGVEIEQI